jgi:hypothetical protein
MLRRVSLVDEWREIQGQLPPGWGDVRLRLTVPDEGDCDRAAALLGPTNPGRRGKVISFFTVRRLLARLDREGIDAELELVGVGAARAAEVEQQRSLATSWDEELSRLPTDWSDLYAEVELASSDHLERAALLLAPLNPARFGGTPGFRFRVARSFGYGASSEMTRRCLERLDADVIRGTLRILWALSDTRPAQTQGPVWYVGGKSL